MRAEAADLRAGDSQPNSTESGAAMRHFRSRLPLTLLYRPKTLNPAFKSKKSAIQKKVLTIAVPSCVWLERQ